MKRAFLAGLAYFAAVFAVGFLLGTIRVLIILPRIGELAAVLLELPVMMIVSWLAAAWLIGTFNVAARLVPRAGMGLSAFAWLMFAELGLAVLVFGRSTAEHLENYGLLSAQIGLAGQIVFALIPMIRLRVDRPARDND